jgi:hypothetical protein
MKKLLVAAAIIAGSCSLALAQGGAAGAGGGAGAGSDVSTPRKGQTSPSPNAPAASRRGDDMPAGMNGVPTGGKRAMAGQSKGRNMKHHKRIAMHKMKKSKNHTM